MRHLTDSGAGVGRRFPSLVDEYLATHAATDELFKATITTGTPQVSGAALVSDHLDPMVGCIYARIKELVGPSSLSKAEAELFIGELSVFARYNATLLLRAADTVRPFCSEFAQELTRNFLEEGGERGKLPAHYIIFTGALIDDLGLRVNGWMPRAFSTLTLLSLIDVLAWSHCPSTILGMYYATEAVAIGETKLLRSLTDRVADLIGRTSRPRLDFYYEMHLDERHEASTDGVAVEAGHQDGIARFIREAALFGFHQPQIIDGFLQMLGPFVDQWVELACLAGAAKHQIAHAVVELRQ
jgi:hypothetical protein